MKTFSTFVIILAAFVISGSACEDALSPSTDSQKFEVKMDGPWVPPADLLAKAIEFDMTYVGAGPWVGTSGCGGSFSTGASFLKSWVEGNFSYVPIIGGYNCRKIAGTNTMSVHATGRALDIHIPLDGGQADNDLGDPIANYLLEHADKMGVQLIIWDRWIWSVGRSGAQRSRPYTGDHDHHDHIHMELTPEASMKMAPWFSDPTPVKGFECEGKIDIEGATIDNKSTCFQMFGSQKFWRTAAGGFSGDLRWTNAFKSDNPSNWARWNMNFSEGGQYKVFYYSVPEFAIFSSTRYVVKHDGKDEEFFIDQSASKEEGWQEIGTYTFAKGASQWVAVHDDSPVNVEEDQHVIADAIRILPIDVNPNNGTRNPNNSNGNNGQTGGTNGTNGDTNGDGDDDISVDEGCSTGSANVSSFPLFIFAFVFLFRRKEEKIDALKSFVRHQLTRRSKIVVR